MIATASSSLRQRATVFAAHARTGWLDAYLTRALFTIGCALGIALAPLPAAAQARASPPRIGMLMIGVAPSSTGPQPVIDSFQQGLREHGYVEGQNILIERRYADGRPGQLAALAAELVQLKVDLILAFGPAPREAARKATSTIPVVTVSGADPVREGWAQSLARPGGNVTGLSVTFSELMSKDLELLKEAFPAVVRVAVLIDSAEVVDSRAVVQEMEASAQRLRLQLQFLEVRGPNDFDAAFSLARQRRAQALLAIATNTVVTHRVRLATLATNDKLPSISEFPLMAQAGFLMTYGADLDDLGRRSAAYMDKILKGAQPGDLAIERPAKFQLVVNLKTARALGIKLPQSLLLRADEVIE